ncbi:hypothetical protein [Actinomadura alba]|uniref:Uncharacterized protein n=1 Tax=Actinomadura alba TaxID=406431 RepID=A0ABR7LWA0_9ACTN|nr:hypothetical protein [Actinomadura alba]MBC6469112.1 hypothetical protein [Actinomadura alba]
MVAQQVVEGGLGQDRDTEDIAVVEAGIAAAEDQVDVLRRGLLDGGAQLFGARRRLVPGQVVEFATECDLLTRDVHGRRL